MKQVFYNPERAKLEKKEKEKNIQEDEKRKRFFEILSRNRGFKKYILEDILDVEINANKTLSNNVEAMVKATPEETKAMLLAKVGALKTAENIKNKIISNF